MPSILSKIPPWPGKTKPVSLTFAFLLRKEINKSPTWQKKDTNIANKIKSYKLENSILKKGLKIGTKKSESTNDPIEPEIVLFGLILVNFLPLKNFPNSSPPISEEIQIENKKNIGNLKLSCEIPENINEENKVK